MSCNLATVTSLLTDEHVPSLCRVLTETMQSAARTWRLLREEGSDSIARHHIAASEWSVTARNSQSCYFLFLLQLTRLTFPGHRHQWRRPDALPGDAECALSLWLARVRIPGNIRLSNESNLLHPAMS